MGAPHKSFFVQVWAFAGWLCPGSAHIHLSKQKRQQREAPALCHLRHFVQMGTGKHESAARIRAVEVGAVFTKSQVATLVILVEVQGQRKPGSSNKRFRLWLPENAHTI